MHGAMTRVFLILAHAFLNIPVLAPASGARAQALAPATVEPVALARVAMPFTCAVDPRAGRLRVQPSPEQIYEIVDRRESQRFSSCRRTGAGPGDERCRTMTVHRFTLQCGAHRVPWMDFAAAAIAARPGLKAEIEDGRLILGSPHVTRTALASRCYDRLHNAPARLRIYESSLLDQCWRLEQGRHSGGEPVRLVLPPGFAPSGPVGARFLPPLKAAPAESSHPRLAFAPQRQAAGGPAEPRRHEAEAIISATGQMPERAAAAAAAGAAGAEPADRDWSAGAGLALLVAGLGTMLGGAAVAYTRLRKRRDLDPVTVVRAGSPDSKAIEQLTAIALERLATCRRCLGELPAAMPLRQVIARELNVSVERLEALTADGAATRDGARRVRVRLHAVTRDLQRLAAIAEGARSSLGGGGALVSTELPEPRDRSEAYAVLGVSPDADARITKKLVEALRQSWHPDQARDDADRHRREHRIKQINVAWDLIQGKRVEA